MSSEDVTSALPESPAADSPPLIAIQQLGVLVAESNTFCEDHLPPILNSLYERIIDAEPPVSREAIGRDLSLGGPVQVSEAELLILSRMRRAIPSKEFERLMGLRRAEHEEIKRVHLAHSSSTPNSPEENTPEVATSPPPSAPPGPLPPAVESSLSNSNAPSPSTVSAPKPRAPRKKSSQPAESGMQGKEIPARPTLPDTVPNDTVGGKVARLLLEQRGGRFSELLAALGQELGVHPYTVRHFFQGKTRPPETKLLQPLLRLVDLDEGGEVWEQLVMDYHQERKRYDGRSVWRRGQKRSI